MKRRESIINGIVRIALCTHPKETTHAVPETVCQKPPIRQQHLTITSRRSRRNAGDLFGRNLGPSMYATPPPEVLGDPCGKEAQEGHGTQQFCTASTILVQKYFYIPDLTVSSWAYKRVYKYSRYCQFVSTSADDPYCCTHLGYTPLRDAYSTSVHRASITAAQGQLQRRRRQSLPRAWCQ